MPNVVSFTPPWLLRPSPGSSFFSGQSSENTPRKTPKGAAGKPADAARYDTECDGPTRTIARRGQEIFTVVDNQIRWANLVTLRDEWRSKEAENQKASQKQEGKEEPYRILNVPVYGSIRQLIVSPNEAFMAIITENTIHISVLPDPVHLTRPDSSPLRLKTYQLGPTTHVLPESPVISALWHPLGIFSESVGCLVTITADAAVRVWELDRNNHWSFDRPTLAIDLKKLIDGTSLDEDFAPSGFGQNKGFSPDEFDMEVASACFGGGGFEEEDGWAPMTLWVAMKSGMLYALCPLLPSKWQSLSSTIASLTTSIIPKMKAIAGDSSITDDERRACQQQYDWLKEIDSQEPLSKPRDSDFQDIEIRSRPANPSAIPRLQGPFQFDTGDESDDLDLTDVLVIPAKSDVDELMGGEEAEYIPEEDAADGLSATVICLVTANSRVHICLAFDGVQGQWLPKTDKGAFTTPVSNPSDLILLESLETVHEAYQRQSSWPTLTQDIHSRYDFFITSANNVSFISLSSWAQRLQAELESPDTSGSAFRLKVLCDGSLSQREEILQIRNEEPSAENTPEHLVTSLVLYDYDLGYLLLTCSALSPHVVALEPPSHFEFSMSQVSSSFEPDSSAPQPLLLEPPRAPYQPPSILYSASPLENFSEKHIPHRHKHAAAKEEIRLSPATLDIVADAHRILSAHTHALERAASDLFRRCERLQGEMHDQLNQLSDAAQRIKGVESELSEEGEQNNTNKPRGTLDGRMRAAVSRQARLQERYEKVRTNLLKSGGRPLSEKEKLWIGEVESFSNSLEDSEKPKAGELAKRLQTARSLAQELLVDGRKLACDSSPNGSPARAGTSTSHPKIPHKLQMAKIADARDMVDRESAVIDAISSRLERLNTTV